MNGFALASAAALVLALSGAHAGETPRQRGDSASAGATAPQPSFRRNGDASRALFDRLDKNGDGYLTGTELTSPDALTSNWVSVDRDGDGRIARSEFTSIDGGDVALGRESARDATRRP